MADLTNFSIKENSDEGVIFPVKVQGRKYPLAIRIYGSDSDVVKDFEKQRLRKLGLKTGKDIDSETLDELIETQNETVFVRIGGIYEYDWKKKEVTNGDLLLNGKKLTNDKASYALLIEAIPDVKDFVLEKSNERTNFLSSEKMN